jgi:hypothetical protein
LAIVGDVAYAALGVEGLALIDISDPLSPTVTSWIDTPGFANDVVVAGNVALVADFDGGLRIINVTQPNAPVEVGFFLTSEAVYGLAVRNNIAYLADGNGGLRLVNFQNWNNPVEVSFWPVPFSSRDVFVSGNYAYVANGGAGLRIINILNPFAPFEVGAASLFGYASSVYVQGQYAYVSSESGGVRVVNVADVTAPFETAEYNTPGTTLDFTIDKGYGWVADLDGGVYIVTADLVVGGRTVDHNDVGFEGVTVAGTAGRGAISDVDGVYSMTGFLPGETYYLTPTLAGYAFAPPNRSFTLVDDTLGQDFIILPEAVYGTIVTGSQTVVGYTDVRGFPTDLDFGPGAVGVTTAVTVTPVFIAVGGDSVFAGHGFDLAADGLADFGRPVTITIDYSDLDVQNVTAENELELRWWNGSGWQDAAETCSPTSGYVRDLVNNMISLAVCKSGRYGLFGGAERVYLPVGFR